MKNMHIYALPIAVGLLGLLVSPLADVAGVAYGLVVTSIVAGILGLRSITQSNVTQTEHWKETLHQELETLVSSNQQIIEEQKTAQLESGEALLRIQHVLEEMHETAKGGQANLSSQLLEIEEKLEDSRVVMSNLGELMVEKMIEAVQSATDEVTDGLNTLEDTLTKQQDDLERTLTKQQDDLETTLTKQQGDLAEELRKSFEGVDQKLEKQTEQAKSMGENVERTIASGMEASAQVITSQTDKFLSHTKEINEFTKEQFNRIVQLFEEVEKLSQVVKLQNDQQNRVITAQLGQLAEISPALVEGISQLTDSKSPERKHLLKIQKNMIAKFADLTS